MSCVTAPPDTAGKPREKVLTPVWGPIAAEDAMAAGAHAAVSSVVIRPVVSRELLERLDLQFTEKIRPRSGDDARALAWRIENAAVFDNPRTLVAHSGTNRGRWRCVNATTMPQPRRVTFSDQLGEPYTDETGDVVVDLLEYKHFYRHPRDQMCRPITADVAELRSSLFAQATSTSAFTA